MKSDTLDTAAPSLSPAAQRQVRMPTTPAKGWLSPRVPVIVICFVGVVLLALLLALNAASPGDRPVIRIACCYDAPSYFSTGHALLFHHSFDLTSEFKVIGQPNEGWSATVPATGKPASVFAIGYSLLEIPFIAAGFVEGDAKDTELMEALAEDCDHLVAAAAMIGGISYFHAFAYDLLAENERITAASFDAAIHAFKTGHLKKITVLSSSMVFESTTVFPSPEDAVRKSPPPQSTYGFQKLATEYFAQGAFEQYGLPFTIARPFNCVGNGERRALRDADITSGNIKLAMSHVVPDLVQKILKGQDPLHILGSGNQVRHYTYGGDLAHGIRLCIEHPAALNQDFNLSTPVATPVVELAEVIWNKIHNGSKPFRYTSDPPYEYDVQMRSPDVSKAEKLIGYRAETTLSQILDEVIPWVGDQITQAQI